jgi:small subunit ribosomal protein S17
MSEARAQESAQDRRKATKVGVVTSDKMDKSVVVRVERTVRHKLYKRFVQRSARFMAHDEQNQCHVGDTVEIVESRPLSARKRWRVRRVLRTAGGSDVPATEGRE